MTIDDGGGDNNYLDNVEDLDDQGSDEMPRSGHRRGYHSKRRPCTISTTKRIESMHDRGSAILMDAHECAWDAKGDPEWIKKTRK